MRKGNRMCDLHVERSDAQGNDNSISIKNIFNMKHRYSNNDTFMLDLGKDYK